MAPKDPIMFYVWLCLATLIFGCTAISYYLNGSTPEMWGYILAGLLFMIFGAHAFFSGKELEARGVILIVFAMMVLGALLYTGWGYLEEKAFIKMATQTQANIIDIKEVRNEGAWGLKGLAYYLAVVQYATSDGQEVRAVSKCGPRQRPELVLNSQITVFYDPQNPEDVRLAGWPNCHVQGGLIFIAIGIFLGAGVFFFPQPVIAILRFLR